jgi:hypothetical protein
MNRSECDGSERASWRFVGDCGGHFLLEQHRQHNYINNTEQYVIWMHIGIAFLQHTFGEPPSGCTLGVLWAEGPHGPGKFPVIALGSDDWTQEVKDYHDRLEQALDAFDKAVDWSKVPQAAQ